MYIVFNTLEEYNSYIQNTDNIKSGNLYIVKDDKMLYFKTNNIDGHLHVYDYLDEIPPEYIIPTGNIELTENGNNIDVSAYATATVHVAGDAHDMMNLIERDIISLDIPSGTTSIGDNAFYKCSSITSITIPNTVTRIGFEAFRSCTGLASVRIPNSVTTMESYAFNGCTSLTSVTIGNGLRGIGDYAFYYCTQLENLNLGNGVTRIGESAFQSCRSLPSVNIPDTVTVIGQYAFNACNGLSSVIFGRGVTTIGQGAFFGCTSLTSIDIPSGVTSIGLNVFNNCSSLSSVTVQAATPPSLGSGTFDNNASGRKIYVPSQSVAAYKAATIWKNYKDYIEAIPT